jgi:hypothetical protein
MKHRRKIARALVILFLLGVSSLFICGLVGVMAVQNNTRLDLELGKQLISVRKYDQQTMTPLPSENEIDIPFASIPANCRHGAITILWNVGSIVVERWDWQC